MKKRFPSVPSSQSEIRNCGIELNAEQLQKIFAGPTTIDFGVIYVKSKMSKYLSVKNELKHCIMVRLIIENEELKQTVADAQIIQSMQTAGFEIIFFSRALQLFKGSVTYIINEKHHFKYAAFMLFISKF